MGRVLWRTQSLEKEHPTSQVNSLCVLPHLTADSFYQLSQKESPHSLPPQFMEKPLKAMGLPWVPVLVHAKQ